MLTPVSEDEFFFFSGPKRALRVPNSLLPRSMHNTGNYIVSLGKVVRWLGEQAENLGVDIYPGFAASQLLFSGDGSVKGVITGEMGISSSGEKKNTYEPGMELHARYTVFAEGCRGHLGKQLIDTYGLDVTSTPQHYGKYQPRNIGLDSFSMVLAGHLRNTARPAARSCITWKIVRSLWD